MTNPTLRPYELPILAGLARGNTVEEIAARTRAPYNTVKNRIQRMRNRLGAPDRAALVAIGYQQGWLAGLPPEPRPPVVLSDQQHAALRCIAAGRTNDQVARALGVRPGTAVEYLRRLYTALGTDDRGHAVALGYQHGHLPLTTCATSAA